MDYIKGIIIVVNIAEKINLFILIFRELHVGEQISS